MRETVTPVGGATFSNDFKYRYQLWRQWVPDGDFLHFVMLNPSTADATVDDPTIRRCIGFAKAEGFGGIVVNNLYALRATQPKHLMDISDPEGPDNVKELGKVLALKMPVVAAWGSFKAKGLKQSQVKLFLMAAALDGGEVWCYGTTKDNQPKHPLYLSGTTARELWKP